MTPEQAGACCYEHPRPALTVDIVLVHLGADGRPRTLLIQRRHPPFEAQWALPGGFVDKDEPLHAAALRELREETALQDLRLEQIGAFGEPGRDPRGWVVSVAFATYIPDFQGEIQAGDDATKAAWWPVDALPPLAFDHKRIIATALEALDFVPRAATNLALSKDLRRDKTELG
ncbi:MAG: NUDIX domain-containing protein [Anaerolineae bacterium]